MKMFNRYIAILCTLAPIILTAAANFDLINADSAKDKTRVGKQYIIYYTYEIANLDGTPGRVPRTGVKELRGIHNLRANIKKGEVLLLDLSGDPKVKDKVTSFAFSPELLQSAVSQLPIEAGVLAAKKPRTADEQRKLEALQKGAVKATTCYITAGFKAPNDKTILLMPQSPTTQYSKQTAQGLSLASNVSQPLVAFLKEATPAVGNLDADQIKFAAKSGIPLQMMYFINKFSSLCEKFIDELPNNSDWKEFGQSLLGKTGTMLPVDIIKRTLTTIKAGQEDLIRDIMESCILSIPNIDETIAAVYDIAGTKLARFTGTLDKYYDEFVTQFKRKFPVLYKELSSWHFYFFAKITALEKEYPGFGELFK